MANSYIKPKRPNRTLIERRCEYCGQSFRIPRPRPGRGRFCGHRCSRVSRNILSPEQRFFNKVNKSGPIVRPEIGPCWVWIAGCDKFGYGSVQHNGRTTVAHRTSWELSGKTIPNGLCVLHRCDNPPCVRPDHLFLGTRADNVQDAMDKGRFRSAGARGNNTLLTKNQVREIRRRYHPHVMSYERLGVEYGVSASAINHIVHRRTWRDI